MHMDPIQGADTQPIAPLPPVAPGIPDSQPSTLGQPPASQALVTETPEAESMGAGDGGNKKKVFLFGGVVVLMLLVIGGAIYFAPRISSQLAKKVTTQVAAVPTQAPKLASAKVTYLEGAAWTVSVEAKTPLYEDVEVWEGDTLETGEDARVTLALEGGSILRLGPSTKITLTNLDSLDLAFSQDSGALFAYVEKGVGRFLVTAGDVTVEAVGTAFSLEKEELLQVNVFENSVKVKEGETQTDVEENSQWIQGEVAAETLDSDAVTSDNFLQWALEEEIQRIEAEIISQVTVPENKEDKEAYIAALKEIGGDKKELIKQAFLTTTTGDVSSITLSGQKTAEGAVALSWTADGLAGEGYRIVWSKTPGKAYPGDKRSNAPLFGYEKTLGPMKPTTSWYYRVCEWVGTTCGVYSNEVYLSF